MSARREWSALAALSAILIVTASWWALALWPVSGSAPDWLVRTREVCFGSTRDGLPDAGGWLLLIGQPLGMLIVLVAVWPVELRAGFARLTARTSGQLTAGAAAALVTAGLFAVAGRVATAGTEPFSAGSNHATAAGLTRVDDPAPDLALVDQQGGLVTLEAFRGRPALVTFAYAHCETVCPLIVSEALTAAARVPEYRPAIIVVTLDPWRDTTSRLPAIAAAWRLHGDARVVSGRPEDVERVLNAWRIPRVRNERTGAISHPSLVYVMSPDGRIRYVVQGNADVLTAALRAL